MAGVNMTGTNRNRCCDCTNFGTVWTGPRFWNVSCQVERISLLMTDWTHFKKSGRKIPRARFWNVSCQVERMLLLMTDWTHFKKSGRKIPRARYIIVNEILTQLEWVFKKKIVCSWKIFAKLTRARNWRKLSVSRRILTPAGTPRTNIIYNYILLWVVNMFLKGTCKLAYAQK